jgi:hypothetical protein
MNKYQDGDKQALQVGANKHLSPVERNMYANAIKHKNSRAISYFEFKINKGLLSDKREQQQEIEKLSEEQGDDMSTRLAIQRRIEKERGGNASGFGMSQRQSQEANLLPRQKNTTATLGNVNVPNTKDKLDKTMDNKAVSKSIVNTVADMLPVIGDVKGASDAWKEYKSTGKISPLTLAGVLPLFGLAGDAAKTFKPVIKDYVSNTEMFTDFLKQAKEQGIEVDRGSKLYGQIKDEIPGAREYYKDLNTKDDDIADALYLSTKSEQAQKELKGSKVQDIYYRGGSKSNSERAEKGEVRVKPEYSKNLELFWATPDKKYAYTYTPEASSIIRDLHLNRKNNELKEQYEESLKRFDPLSIYEGVNAHKYIPDKYVKNSKHISPLLVSTKTPFTNNIERPDQPAGSFGNLDNESVRTFYGTSEEYKKQLTDKTNKIIRETPKELFGKNSDNLEEFDKALDSYYESHIKGYPDLPNILNNTGRSKNSWMNERKKEFTAKLKEQQEIENQINSLNKESLTEPTRNKDYDAVIGKEFSTNAESIAVRKPTQFKSLFREHLGKWDWSNPNIHKALIGGSTVGIGSGLYNQKEQHSKGGSIKKKLKSTSKHPQGTSLMRSHLGEILDYQKIFPNINKPTKFNKGIPLQYTYKSGGTLKSLKKFNIKANDKEYKTNMSKDIVTNSLKEGAIKGKKLTDRQRNLFEAIKKKYDKSIKKKK